MKRKTRFHFTDERPVEADGEWLSDPEELSGIAEDLLRGIEGELDWQIAPTSIWHTISERWHADFIEIIQRRDVGALAYSLRNLHALPLLKGIDQSRDETIAFQNSEERRRGFLVEMKSLLVRLAEALGVLDLEMDPRYRAPANIYLPTKGVVEGIERNLGIDLSPPRIGEGRFGLEIGDNSVITNRDIYALYLANRCREIARKNGRSLKQVRVLEVGGGMGRLAYYLHKMGFRHILLVDLPQIALIQAYFLKRSVGPSVTLGQGDVRRRDHIVISARAGALSSQPDGAFDIALNSDSMPEMGWQVARDYAQSIRRVCRGGVFLSANQESRKEIGEDGVTHAVVGQVLQETGGYERVYRYPFWLRDGYVEELYRITD